MDSRRRNYAVFYLCSEDITEMDVDAVVNAANANLRMGSGVCGAIFRAAGAEQMEKACRPLRPVKTGEAVITPGFDLPARYVIHTPGPIYREEQAEACEEQLRASYRNSLHLAEQYHCESLAFPLISSGAYGYPKEEALQVAISEICKFLETHRTGGVSGRSLPRWEIMPRQEQRDMEWYLAEQYTGDEPAFHHGAVYGALPDIDLSEGKCILPGNRGSGCRDT